RAKQRPHGEHQPRWTNTHSSLPSHEFSRISPQDVARLDPRPDLRSPRPRQPVSCTRPTKLVSTPNTAHAPRLQVQRVSYHSRHARRSPQMPPGADAIAGDRDAAIIARITPSLM